MSMMSKLDRQSPTRLIVASSVIATIFVVGVVVGAILTASFWVKTRTSKVIDDVVVAPGDGEQLQLSTTEPPIQVIASMSEDGKIVLRLIATQITMQDSRFNQTASQKVATFDPAQLDVFDSD